MMVGMRKFPYHSLSSVHSHFLVERQAKVSAIRFFPTSPPDSVRFSLESVALHNGLISIWQISNSIIYSIGLFSLSGLFSFFGQRNRPDKPERPDEQELRWQ